MPIDRRAFGASMGAAALSLAAGPLLAQAPGTFPSRPIRIVPFGTPGAPLDILARVYGEKLQARWGQPIVVETKPGAGGIIAADFVAKAAPDGHTVLFTLPASHINAAILQPKLPYDPFKDFQPLSIIGTGGVMLVARADAPYNNAREFVEFARKQPKGLTYGTWGNGSSGHLMGELLKRQAGVNLIHVAYKGEAPAHNDLFGNALDFAWANPATAKTHSQSGRIKVLGVTGTRRLSVLPQVPTFTEQGFAGFDLDSWWGIYGPAKMPQPVVDAWAAALREITAMPDVSARVVAFGLEPLGNTPAQFADRMKQDYARYAELIKAAGVTVE
ncbi:tripartite tricarboxylate transporter substrate binding protein [Ramlibacter sp. AW1]|uniref:Tripartite tricarboxylate transporter substrate binding protein n=1 Tax=Ramlibacter aurantiacus TaxID=2801330 RepID=A0A937D4R8_9BURK|nr:tripartite tricarboxylate transporter substrate binding protein [Ramlibacter aurantiacus]MBL0420592.1 tripartite tricarboxylate transporter substrate binding protein [Ramlibacter aurantiacus]